VQQFSACSLSASFLPPWRNSPSRPWHHYRGFTITLRHITLGSTPLDEWSARRRDLNLTTHNTHKTDKHQCPRCDSNQQSQPASGHRPTPQTARPLGSTPSSLLICLINIINMINITQIHNYVSSKQKISRSRWPRGLRRGCATARWLELRVRIAAGTCLSVSCECCVLLGRGLCDGLITRPEESYWVWCVWVWSWSHDNVGAMVY